MTTKATTLKRTVFKVSRALEYFTESELQMQIGAGRETWPAAILKELVDNALDAAETAGVAPMIEVEIDGDGFSVRDNGPGIPAQTVQGSLDYNIRVSDKLGYVTPTRGRLGNALKVIWAAPFVATGTSHVVIRSQGARHEIRVGVDAIEQKPAIDHEVTTVEEQKGTEIRVHWPDSARLLTDPKTDVSYKTDPPTAQELVEAFAAFNPHATFRMNGDEIPATVQEWRKWLPSNPLVAHWYDEDTFRDLVAHYIASERCGADPCTVRAFVANFRGLTSTVKQKTVTEGFKATHLHELVTNGDLDTDALDTLLGRMKQSSKPPQPAALGVIGKDHLTSWMCERANVAEDSIVYRKKTGVENGMPHVVEMAFGVSNDDGAMSRIVTGLNWSPTLAVPAQEIQSLIGQMRLDPGDPVVAVFHMSKPSWKYTGKGKERVEL